MQKIILTISFLFFISKGWSSATELPESLLLNQSKTPLSEPLSEDDDDKEGMQITLTDIVAEELLNDEETFNAHHDILLIDYDDTMVKRHKHQKHLPGEVRSQSLIDLFKHIRTEHPGSAFIYSNGKKFSYEPENKLTGLNPLDISEDTLNDLNARTDSESIHIISVFKTTINDELSYFPQYTAFYCSPDKIIKDNKKTDEEIKKEFYKEANGKAPESLEYKDLVNLYTKKINDNIQQGIQDLTGLKGKFLPFVIDFIKTHWRKNNEPIRNIYFIDDRQDNMPAMTKAANELKKKGVITGKLKEVHVPLS